MAKEKKEKPDKKAKAEKKEKKTKKEQKAKAESTSKKKSNANLEKIRSTQIFSPIQDVRDGIIITKDRHFVKVMEFSPINFGLRSASEQAVIIDQFAAVLRVMPIRAHFKIICRESNVQKFVEKIKEEMDQETNPNCLALQKEQMNLISSVSQVQGVSRRFLVAFEYEDENFFSKSPSFEDVKINLNRIAWSIKNSMSRCGNDLISIDDNEQRNLRNICDEVFGESNFICNCIWKSKSGGANDSRHIATDHEYVVCYAKQAENLPAFMDKDAVVTTSYNLRDEHGEYSLDRLDKQSLGYIESLDFPIVGPDGQTYTVEHKNPAVKVARWRWSKETVAEFLNETWQLIFQIQ